jgi:1,4-alpha-glucan branching enzyme
VTAPLHAEDTSLRERVLAARLHEPHAYLGPHRAGPGWTYRAVLPTARRVFVATDDGWTPMARDGHTDLFTWHGGAKPPSPCRLRVEGDNGVREFFDPYSFEPTLTDFELHLFGAGHLLEAYRALGANPLTLDGAAGMRFAVWSPNAERVSLVGEFNQWNGRAHPLQSRGSSGVWEIFVPGMAADTLYKYELRNRATGAVFLKSDPYARAFELRPGTAACTPRATMHAWEDADWLTRRAQWDWQHAPINIYEVHAGSWMRHPDGRLYSYRELADRLVPYVAGLGCTHIELMPISEHPLDESWGYQTTGYFAPTRRFGDADDLRAFIDRCHAHRLGVLLDWVPGHFPSDDFALAHYDGTALYEHEDPRQKVHPDWGTHVFNYGRAEVRSFLLSSAHYWLDEFHFDGLRVDAVASMLYLDYSREPGQWTPNRYGGRENLEAIELLRELNTMVHGRFPGAITIAEESTAWPMVSRPAYVGGLGFSMKWNMGWMHDTLEYMRHDPVHRRYHHQLLTFGQLYANSENFVLPFSHDEVVHGKRSLVGRMPGDAWQQFANVRLLFAYQMTAPGKKLNFMGNEFAQGREWNERRELEWPLLASSWHAGVARLFRDASALYRDRAALHDLDFAAAGFSWIDCNDADRSVISYLRMARDGSSVVVALNFTPVPRREYRLGVPAPGTYREILNTDSHHYGGNDVGNAGAVCADATPWMGRPASIAITLPPLAAVVFARDSGG